MIIIKDTTQFNIEDECAVTIGKFDGIHRGHRELIDRIIKKKEEGLKACVFTFDKSPLEFFSGKIVPGLTTVEEKRRIFEFLGVDILVEFPLNEKTAATDPEEFIEKILISQLNMKYIAAGTDITFGYKGLGKASLIKEKALNKYEYEIVDKLLINGDEVSSSLIREIVASGDMERASNLIGVPYAIHGNITRGNQIGRTIGFPTINIEVSRDKLMPPFGVYYTEISIEGRHYNGITNVGTKPTVTDDETVFAETNILDFDEDVYDKGATVKLLHFARPERKFNNLDELKTQISNDIDGGVRFFALHK